MRFPFASIFVRPPSDLCPLVWWPFLARDWLCRLPLSALGVILLLPGGALHQRSKLRQLLMLAMIIGSLFPAIASGQSKSAAPLPAQKNSPVGPPAPQSKHHPTLLLAFGNSPNWSVRIGLKGPE